MRNAVQDDARVKIIAYAAAGMFTIAKKECKGKTMLDITARQGRIGCSQIASCIGIGYDTPLGIYEKILGLCEDEDSEILISGREAQEASEKKYMRLYGAGYRQLEPRNNTLSDKYPWLCGSPDMLLESLDGETLRGVEIKNPVRYDNWGREGDDYMNAVPMHHILQCHGYMMLFGLSEWDIVARFTIMDFRRWTIKRDEKMAEEIDVVCSHFWREHLQKRVPPPASTPQEYASNVVLNGNALTADAALASAVAAYQAVRAEVKDKEEKNENLKLRIMEQVGSHDRLIDADGRTLGSYRASKNGKKSFVIA